MSSAGTPYPRKRHKPRPTANPVRARRPVSSLFETRFTVLRWKAGVHNLARKIYDLRSLGARWQKESVRRLPPHPTPPLREPRPSELSAKFRHATLAETTAK